MNWWVFIQSRDLSGALSYIYPFTVYDKQNGHDAIDHVLNTYCATRDGQRFLLDSATILNHAWATPIEHTIETDLLPIDQPQYRRAER